MAHTRSWQILGAGGLLKPPPAAQHLPGPHLLLLPPGAAVSAQPTILSVTSDGSSNKIHEQGVVGRSWVCLPERALVPPGWPQQLPAGPSQTLNTCGRGGDRKQSLLRPRGTQLDSLPCPQDPCPSALGTQVSGKHRREHRRWQTPGSRVTAPPHPNTSWGGPETGL